jgi:hypothetical protein
VEETRRMRSGNWQVYAAVTGSALAMVTNASAGTIHMGPLGISAKVGASVSNVPQMYSTVRTYNGGTQKVFIPKSTHGSNVVHLTNGKGVPLGVDFRIGVGQLSTDGLRSGGALLTGGSKVGFLHKGSKSTNFSFAVKNLTSMAKVSAGAGYFKKGLNIVASQHVPCGCSAQPAWLPGVKGYAGFSFSYNGQTDYGWVKLQYTLGANGLANEIDVSDVQFTLPDGPSTPEPSTAALSILAAGASGVAVLRRRRTQGARPV